MTFTFKRGVRENVPLLIGLAGGTGSGKTRSAMRLATGLSAGKPFAVIDTEAGRANHYANDFTFDHGDLRAPFTPEAYTAAIVAADEAHYPVVIVDSASHEWAGDGGILDMADAEKQRMGGGENVAMAAWIKPKGSHKHMVTKLLQVRAHVILCFRAEPKIEMVRNPETRRMEVVEKIGPGGFKGWLPVAEKNLPYELTASFLLMAERPGIPIPIKLEEQMRAFFPLDRVIDEHAGELLAAWSAGGELPAQKQDVYAGVIAALGVRSMKQTDMAAYFGQAVTRDNWKALVASVLEINPNLTPETLVQAAQDKMREGAAE